MAREYGSNAQKKEWIFLYGDDALTSQDCGPHLASFTTQSLGDVSATLKKEWLKCLQNQHRIPLESLKVYHDDGTISTIRQEIRQGSCMCCAYALQMTILS